MSAKFGKSSLLMLALAFLFFVLGSSHAETDTTLVKPVLLRYDVGSKSYTAPFDTEVVLKEGDKLYLTGSSFPGAKVNLIVGAKSIVTDMVSSGSWGKEILVNDIPTGTDTIVGQSVSGTKTSEPTNLLKIKVEKEEVKTEDKESKSLITNPYVIGGFVVLVLTGVSLFFWKKSSLNKK